MHNTEPINETTQPQLEDANEPPSQRLRKLQMDQEDLTQKLNTQETYDPRRKGQNNSGFSEQEESDIICVLHPASKQAIRIVEHTALQRRQHVLPNGPFAVGSQALEAGNEAETLIIGNSLPAEAIALRFSSNVNDPCEGFCFGRNQIRCDVNLDPERTNKRISNQHFRIFYNPHGTLMIEDQSTNGTIVDKITLGGRRHPNPNPTKRMLQNGSVIEILCPEPDEVINFIVRIPTRYGCEEAYRQNLAEYVDHFNIAGERRRRAKEGHLVTEAATRRVTAAPFGGPPNSRALPPASMAANKPGMQWDGGGRYNCVGTLGKGAFAIVYQVATVDTGEIFAAKELAKKRFIKNGVLDTRLDNEMQIMQGLSHPHIVQYVEYAETKEHLYIIMEFVAMGDLQGYLASHGMLPESMAKDMSIQQLQALAYLHERNITHRDIKPDNILISSELPFITKLTDFGLSKVVKNNETFLKTFCGTLLYCAPEVFPHFTGPVHNSKGQKRRRGPGVKRHSYSQLVDIWSYAAVLWTVLCGKSPFEGVMDRTGEAMFKRIMSTALDTTPLEKANISRECIDLLDRMLDTDPSTRPSELECLAHPWLNPDVSFEDMQEIVIVNGLASIAEEAHENDAVALFMQSRAGQELHQVEGPGQDQQGAANQDGSDESSSFGDIGRSHLAKRFKSGVAFDNDDTHDVDFRGLPRQDAVLASASSDALGLGMPLPEEADLPATAPPAVGHKLFGEISQGAIQRSGPFHRKPDNMFPDVIPNSSSPVESADNDLLDAPGSPIGEHVNQHSVDSARSLGGAEDMVRDLHMTSLQHGGREPSPHPHNPSTPSASLNKMDKHDPLQTPTRQDQTPRAAVLNPQLHGSQNGLGHFQPAQKEDMRPEDAAGPQSFQTANESNDSSNYHHSFQHGQGPSEPSNASTDYGSMPSGFQHAQGAPESTKASTDYGSMPSGLNSLEEAHSASRPGGDEFAKPLPRLGRLVSTPDSFTELNLPLTNLRNTWGRHGSNSIVYRDSMDNRIPKIAFDIVFHLDTPYDADSKTDERTDEEILSSPDVERLQAYIHPRSRNGLLINEVHISEHDDAGRQLYGTLFHGDTILVSRLPKGGGEGEGKGERLIFKAEIFHGLSKTPRQVPGFVVQRTK